MTSSASATIMSRSAACPASASPIWARLSAPVPGVEEADPDQDQVGPDRVRDGKVDAALHGPAPATLKPASA